jgi:hypothetical protein
MPRSGDIGERLVLLPPGDDPFGFPVRAQLQILALEEVAGRREEVGCCWENEPTVEMVAWIQEGGRQGRS